MQAGAASCTNRLAGRRLAQRLRRCACAALLIGAAGCGDGEWRTSDGSTPTVAPTVMPTAALTAAPTDVPTADPTATTASTALPTAVATTAPTASPGVVGGPIAMRRLTAAQYKASIADILGEDIVVAGRIEPDNRRSGLLAVGLLVRQRDRRRLRAVRGHRAARGRAGARCSPSRRAGAVYAAGGDAAGRRLRRAVHPRGRRPPAAPALHRR